MFRFLSHKFFFCFTQNSIIRNGWNGKKTFPYGKRKKTNRMDPSQYWSIMAIRSLLITMFNGWKSRPKEKKTIIVIIMETWYLHTNFIFYNTQTNLLLGLVQLVSLSFNRIFFVVNRMRIIIIIYLGFWFFHISIIIIIQKMTTFYIYMTGNLYPEKFDVCRLKQLVMVNIWINQLTNQTGNKRKTKKTITPHYSNNNHNFWYNFHYTGNFPSVDIMNENEIM